MLERSRELLAIDLTEIDVRKGVLGTIAVVVAVVVISLAGLVGETAGLAVLFVLVADSPGTTRERFTNVLTVTVAGSVIAFVAVWVGTDSAPAAALLTFTITALATLASGRDPTVASRALILSIWAILALSFSGDMKTALELALAFMMGGVIATVVLWFEPRSGSAESIEGTADATLRSFEELIRSPLAVIAVVRASAVAVGTALGIVWYPEHPVWPALTVLLVMANKPGEAIGAGLLRAFGTLMGVAAAEVVVEVAGGSEAVMLIAFFVSAYAMFAFKHVAYWVYVLFLTSVLVLMQALVGADAGATATDRLTATLLGAAIAIVGISIGWVIAAPEDRLPSAD